METNAVYFGELSNNRQRLSIDIRHLRSLSGSQAQCRQIRRRLELEGRQRQGILIKILNRSGSTRSLDQRSGETESLHAEFVAGMARGVHLDRAPAVVTAPLRKLDKYYLSGRNLIAIGNQCHVRLEAIGGVKLDAGLLVTTDRLFLITSTLAHFLDPLFSNRLHTPSRRSEAQGMLFVTADRKRLLGMQRGLLRSTG